MLAVIGIILIIIICFGPMAWAQYILKKHSNPRADFPGTGGEFARHILDLAKLNDLPVEKSSIGDHYDPLDKAVRLEENNFNGNSLTAVVVAAHEVGHALQDRDKYTPLRIRTNLAKVAQYGEIIAKMILYSTPLLTYMSPRLAILSIGLFVAIMAFRVILHLVTLPVEFDASFNRALPILEAGNYIPKADMKAANSILTACALTYVAATLFSIIDIIRWFRFGR